MSKVINQRLPREVGEKQLPLYAGIKSPWEKITSYGE
jgi:hypothetical protein